MPIAAKAQISLRSDQIRSQNLYYIEDNKTKFHKQNQLTYIYNFLKNGGIYIYIYNFRPKIAPKYFPLKFISFSKTNSKFSIKIYPNLYIIIFKIHQQYIYILSPEVKSKLCNNSNQNPYNSCLLLLIFKFNSSKQIHLTISNHPLTNHKMFHKTISLISFIHNQIITKSN